MDNELNASYKGPYIGGINIFKPMVYGDKVPESGYDILADGVYKGYKARVISYGTHPCCYIKLEQGHRFYETPWHDVNVGVHGGITFAERVGKNYGWDDGRLEDGFWIGWDYAHLGDCMDGTCEGKRYSVYELVSDIRDAVDQMVAMDAADESNGDGQC